MTETTAAAVLIALGAYLGLGAVFAGVFLILGVGRIDPDGATMPVRVRLLSAPGCAALWPLLAAKWARALRAERP